jgi:hypothetical protein
MRMLRMGKKRGLKYLVVVFWKHNTEKIKHSKKGPPYLMPFSCSVALLVEDFKVCKGLHGVVMLKNFTSTLIIHYM